LGLFIKEVKIPRDKQTKSGGFMKTPFILLLGLILSFTAYSQSCLPDGITFNWQADIDYFQTNYPGCTQIEGDVTMALLLDPLP
jgi:hypothetical protein